MSRLLGSASILSAILLVVALVCGVSVATSLYVDRQGTAGLRAELATRAGEDLALRASLDLAEDAAEQDAEVRAAVAKTFGSTGVAFDVTRTLEAGAIYSIDGRSGPIWAETVADLESRADFATGAVPSGVNQVAVQADAAAVLGLGVGDAVEINQIPFEVSGTWRAQDAFDPRWYGDESVATGGSDRLGPFVITEEGWTRLDSPPTAVWTIVPASIDELTSNNSASVSAAWATVERNWRGEVSEFDSLQLQRQLALTLDGFDRRVAGLRALELVAAVLVAGSALVVLSQLIQLLVATRERETLLFWARGRSAAAIARRTAVEMAGVAALGVLVAVAVVVVWVSSIAELRPSALIVPAVAVVGGIVFAGLASFRSAATIASSRGRARRGVIPGVALLVVIAAALAVWQLQLYGSPLTRSADGPTRVDPIVVAAPALALVAVVLVALAAFPSLASLYARATRHARVGTYLTARTLVRQVARVAAPLVVVALAVGTATVGATYSATWNQLFTITAELHAGADVRVSSPLAPLAADQLDAVAATEHVTAVAPFDVQSLSVGAVTGAIVAAAPDALRQVATDAQGTFAGDDAADAIRVTSGPQIPEGATGLTLRVEALGFETPPALSAWIADSFGSLRDVTFGQPVAVSSGVFEYGASLPESAAGASSSLVSLDLSFGSPTAETTAPSVRLEGLAAQVAGATQTVELDQFWAVDTLSDIVLPPPSNAAGDGFVLDSFLPWVRMTPTLDGTERDIVRPTVVVTQRLADLLDVQVGSLISFDMREALEDVSAEVAAVVPAIPGADTDTALLMDLSVVNHFHQRASRAPAESTDLWVATTEQQPVRDLLRTVLPANAQVDLSEDPVGRQVLGAASVALWAAAVCCILFALVAVGAASRSRLRWGRGEIAALRAIGMRAREQATVVARELGVVLAVAAIAGVAAGVLVSVLTVPQLARAAVDRGGLAVASLSVDWPGLGLLLGALALGVAVILFDFTRRVRSLASRLLPGEGDE